MADIRNWLLREFDGAIAFTRGAILNFWFNAAQARSFWFNYNFLLLLDIVEFFKFIYQFFAECIKIQSSLKSVKWSCLEIIFWMP